VLNSLSFAAATVLIAGVNLFAMALVIRLLLGIAIAIGLGFVLSFGYWTTNFAEVQRALAAKNLSAARRTR